MRLMRQDGQIRTMSAQLVGAKATAFNDLVRRFAEDERLAERALRAAMHDAAEKIGALFGAEIGRRIAENREVFIEVQKLRDALLTQARTLYVEGGMAWSQVEKRMVHRVDITIPPVRRSFHFMR